jgi:hypothetical protein
MTSPLRSALRLESEELRKRSRMLEPGLKVTGAGLDNSTWVEAFRHEPRKRGLVEIVGFPLLVEKHPFVDNHCP